MSATRSAVSAYRRWYHEIYMTYIRSGRDFLRWLTVSTKFILINPDSDLPTQSNHDQHNVRTQLKHLRVDQYKL